MNEPFLNSNSRSRKTSSHVKRKSTLRTPNSTCFRLSPLPDLSRVKFLQRQRTMKKKLRTSTFRESQAYLTLESAVASSEELQRLESENFDFTSEKGQSSIKQFLSVLESLVKSLSIKVRSRLYREKFSVAYQELFKPGALSYLPEIVDSAQEQIPFLWVNSEKYVFSSEVLQAGSNLYSFFAKILKLLRKVYDDPSTHNVLKLQQKLKIFDALWASYEEMYILELMVIEEDARRYIRKAVKIEQDVCELEDGSYILNRRAYNIRREKLLKILGKINSIANLEGKGRDDLSIDILLAAEAALQKPWESSAINALASNVMKAFVSLRRLIARYRVNVEEVDPQLMNNEELVQGLVMFETHWTKGKTFLASPTKKAQLSGFSTYLESITKKFSSFQTMVEERDAEIFLIIPQLLALLALESWDLGMLKEFRVNPDEDIDKLKDLYKRNSHTQTFFDTIERAVITQEADHSNSDLVEALKIIRTLGIEIQRSRPADWNLFLNAALDHLN